MNVHMGGCTYIHLRSHVRPLRKIGVTQEEVFEEEEEEEVGHSLFCCSYASAATKGTDRTDFFSENRMNQTYSLDKNYEYIVLPALYIVVFIIGLGANAWGLKLLLQKWRKVGHINVFLVNLGLVNFLFLPTLPFLSAYYFMKTTWIFGDAFCKITRFCFNLNLYGSIGFLTCISVYRYLAVVHPMRVLGRIRVTHSVVISVIVWLLVSVQSLPDMFFTKKHRKITGRCYHSTSNDYVADYLPYSLGWTLTGFCIPFLITLGCYGHVTLVLCRTNTTDKMLKQRSLKLLFILIFLFSVCYIPYHLFKNLSLYSRVLQKQKRRPEWDNGVYTAHQISRGLVCLNSVLNPLVYLHVMIIPAQLRQLFQRSRQMFVSKSGSIPVEQNEEI